MSYLKEVFLNLTGLKTNAKNTARQLQQLKLMAAKPLCKEAASARNLEEAEFQVFSQWGDDGIIQYLIQNLQIDNKYFIEFGVENYEESNTRFLLLNNNWSGLVMDGSVNNISYIKQDEIYWRHDLKAKTAFVTKENINELIAEEGIEGSVGILHIDVDGNDYWIWKSINVIDPVIVIIEYNSLFGGTRPVTIPYDAEFVRTRSHFSNLFYGTSLSSLGDLAEEKGYFFAGCNSAGNNAYFVKNNTLGKVPAVTIEDGYRQAKFRESRNEKGELTFLNHSEKISLLSGMKVFNTRTNEIEAL